MLIETESAEPLPCLAEGLNSSRGLKVVVFTRTSGCCPNRTRGTVDPQGTDRSATCGYRCIPTRNANAPPIPPRSSSTLLRTAKQLLAPSQVRMGLELVGPPYISADGEPSQVINSRAHTHSNPDSAGGS